MPCFNTQPPEGGWYWQVADVAEPWLFQHTAARRRLGSPEIARQMNVQFQHTAARRRLVSNGLMAKGTALGFNTQPPEGGWGDGCSRLQVLNQVSTHSRPKAAGYRRRLPSPLQGCFNTQPPEGGWVTATGSTICAPKFQHTAARRRLVRAFTPVAPLIKFQHTAARRRLGPAPCEVISKPSAFQHTAARRRLGLCMAVWVYCVMRFNTQPPEGGWG